MMWSVHTHTSKCVPNDNQTKRNRTEQNRTEQNRTEQNRTEQNRTEQNNTTQNNCQVSTSVNKCQQVSTLVNTCQHLSTLVNTVSTTRSKQVCVAIVSGPQFLYLRVVASSWRTRQCRSKAAGATTQTVPSPRTFERRYGLGRE